MKLIREQFLETPEIDKVLSSSVLVIVIGYSVKKALLSLKKQIYLNFRVVCINKTSENNEFSGETNLVNVTNGSIQERIFNIIDNAEEEYVYIMNGEDTIFPNTLLEYARYLNEQEYDAVYADECLGNVETGEVYRYELKPNFEYIAALQNLYSGRAVIWKKETLCKIIKKTISKEVDTFLRELFLLSIENNGKIGQIPLVLLLKGQCNRDVVAEKKLIPLIQRIVTKNTKWFGKVTKTSSFEQSSFELIDVKGTSSFEFLVIEEDLNRTKQLLSQIAVSYANSRVIVAVKKEHLEQLTEWCRYLGMSDVLIKEKDKDKEYVKTLNKLKSDIKNDVQIILNDQVQWLNRMNVERFMLSFNKPEVKVACPQIATEGEKPLLIYAGGELNSLALTSTYLKGRTQNVNFGYDMAWMNRRVTNLTSYCIALRKEVWCEIFPMHTSINESWQFALELSFLCRKKDIICEYVGQSAFWVNQDIGKWYIKQDDCVEIEKDFAPIQCSGYYWHWLNEYSDIIETMAEKMSYAQRSYKRYLQQSFKVFGLEHINETGNKRVLVLSHELSFTGAPLVLVQAVESLKKMNYDVLVVSPIDGPLRETYLKNNVPVIIEPELYTEFEYIRMAHDFDFVIACTVCLWPVIEVLGQTNIPVLWWVHDSRMGYINWLRYVLPKTIGDNIHLYCGGDYAQKVILEYRPEYSSKILLYGLDDFSNKIESTLDRESWDIPRDKIAFANIGQIISRKGQDVLVDAIEKLPKELLKQSVFVFVGGVVDRKIYNKIIDLKNRYPENIRYIKQISHEDLKQFYREIDCVICSSVDDPLPAFVAEGLMMSRVVICSKNTAFNGLIEDGKNGFLFESGNQEELYQHVCNVIENKNRLEQIGENARKLYEDTFTDDIFNKNFRNVICEDLLKENLV